MSPYRTILERLPANMPAGKTKIIGHTLDVGMKLAEQVATIGRRDDLTAKGRAGMLRAYLKTTAGPAFEKSKRQYDWHERQIDTRRATVRKKALGEQTPLDAELRTVLRSMTPAERVQAVLTNPEFRGAALRGGAALAGIGPDVFQRAFDSAVAENAAEESAALQKTEAEQATHAAALGVVQVDMKNVPAVDDANTGARVFRDARELADFLAKEVAPAATHVRLREESEADENEAA